MNDSKAKREREQERRRRRYERDRALGCSAATVADTSAFRVRCRGGFRIMREGMKASY